MCLKLTKNVVLACFWDSNLRLEFQEAESNNVRGLQLANECLFITIIVQANRCKVHRNRQKAEVRQAKPRNLAQIDIL